MIIKGSKQQRNVAKRTKQLQNDIKKLVLDYEQEVGLEVTKVACYKDNSFNMPTYEVSVDVALPKFKDEEEDE